MSHKVSLFMTHLQLNMGLVQLVQMIHADVCVRVSRINRAKKKKKSHPTSSDPVKASIALFTLKVFG